MCLCHTPASYGYLTTFYLSFPFMPNSKTSNDHVPVPNAVSIVHGLAVSAICELSPSSLNQDNRLFSLFVSVHKMFSNTEVNVLRKKSIGQKLVPSNVGSLLRTPETESTENNMILNNY